MTEIITNIESHWQPNKWVAVLLCFILVPVGMLYLGRKTWAIFYFILILIIVMLRFTLLSVYTDDDLWWMFSALNLTGMVHAFWLAGKVNKPRPWYSRWYGVTAVVLIFVIPLLTVKVFVYDLFRIPADSMAPTLLVGDVLNISKWGCGNYRYLGITVYHTKRGDSCEIKRGDVIAFQYPPNPNQDYIKRVVAVGGDDVSYYDDTLLINGEEVEFEFIDSNDEFSFYEETLDGSVYQTQYSNRDINHPFKFTKLKVPANHYYVLGDNRDNSSDSRVWGLVPEENVIGKLSHIYRK